jgi:hypothetical protein
MLSEIESISSRIAHEGEKGRNNEAILREFLKDNLPTRYTVSTGKVVAAGGRMSGQVDLIVHDRLFTPAFIVAKEWSLVPIESVFCVISVKTTLSKPELADAMKSIESVRSLPRTAAMAQIGHRFQLVPENEVLRPRAFVLSFKTSWRSLASCQKAFTTLLDSIHDDNRPNGVCIINKGFLLRRAYTTTVTPHPEQGLLHFFLFLVRTMGKMPQYHVDLSRYFSDDYGE